MIGKVAVAKRGKFVGVADQLVAGSIKLHRVLYDLRGLEGLCNKLAEI